jgi:hypothetical protein
MFAFSWDAKLRQEIPEILATIVMHGGDTAAGENDGDS